MNICIAGWYFKKESLDALASPDSFIVAHRPGDPRGIQMKIIPNLGLEFGCYSYYLSNVWKGDPVLFTHDDNLYTGDSLELISEITVDHAFIFSTEEEAKRNGCAHGRAFYCSDAFLRQLKEDGGFWFDEGNRGDIPPTTDLPDYHNSGIRVFQEYLKGYPFKKVGVCAIVPGVQLGYRGEVLNGAIS